MTRLRRGGLTDGRILLMFKKISHKAKTCRELGGGDRGGGGGGQPAVLPK